MGRFLRGENWTVLEAENGQEAVERFAASPVDVVVTDLLMPKLDGIGVVVQIRALDPQVPVIVLTGHGTVERCREALKAGAADFLLKPCEPDEFLTILDRALKTRRQASTAERSSGTGIHDLEITVPALLTEKQGVLNRVESNALDLGYGRRSWSIRLALDEAFVNAVIHGAGSDAARSICVKASFGATTAVVAVTDPGPGFAPPGDDLAFPTETGGRGLFLLRSFCDKVEWVDGGRTCRMTFVKKPADAPGAIPVA